MGGAPSKLGAVWCTQALDYMGDGSTSTIMCGIDWAVANAKRLNIKVGPNI